MNEQQYYQEIEHLIKKHEVSKRARSLEENNDLVTTYWNVGRLIVEAQGGSKRAKYGNELIKKWSVELTNKYGKGYDATNLRRFRQFYIEFQKYGTVSRISWSIISVLLPVNMKIKETFSATVKVDKFRRWKSFLKRCSRIISSESWVIFSNKYS